MSLSNFSLLTLPGGFICELFDQLSIEIENHLLTLLTSPLMTNHRPDLQQWIFCNIGTIKVKCNPSGCMRDGFADAADVERVIHEENHLNLINKLLIGNYLTHLTELSVSFPLTGREGPRFDIGTPSELIFPKEIIFPNLKVLKINRLFPSTLHQLTRNSIAKFPKLQVLEIEQGWACDDSHFELFSSFISSLPLLEKIILPRYASPFVHPDLHITPWLSKLSNISFRPFGPPRLSFEGLKALLHSRFLTGNLPLSPSSDTNPPKDDVNCENRLQLHDNFIDNNDKSTSLCVNRLTSINFSNQPISEDLVSFLAYSCPHLSNITELIFNRYTFTDNDIDAICNSPYLNQLKQISFLWNRAEILQKMSQSPNMTNLCHFSISMSENHPQNSLQYLTSSTYIKNLRDFKLFAYTGRDGTECERMFIDFIQSKNIQHLTSLFLQSCELTPKCLNALFNSPMLSNLTSLGLHAMKVQESSNLDQQESVTNCHNNSPAHDWMKHFSQSPYLSNLTSVQLLDCDLNDRDLEEFSFSRNLSHVTKLLLSCNPRITALGFKSLISSPHLHCLEELLLSYCPELNPVNAARALIASPRMLFNLKYLVLPTGNYEENASIHAMFKTAGWGGKLAFLD